MANYIQTLQLENKALKESIDNCKLEILEFTKHLSSSKFHCGDPLDNYINTQDCYRWAESIFRMLR